MACSRGRPDDLVRDLGWRELPLGVKGHPDARIEEKALVTADLGQELAPPGLEVKDEQESVPVRRGDVSAQRRRSDRRAVGAVGAWIWRGDRGDQLEGGPDGTAERGEGARGPLDPGRVSFRV